LEKANIIINKNMLPSDKDPEKPAGIRIGVQELTRIGMKGSEMREIAALIARVVIGGEDENRIKDEVLALRGGFQHIHYCSDDGDAYAFPAT
jgi:glycine hydroxymethyltransferase